MADVVIRIEGVDDSGDAFKKAGDAMKALEESSTKAGGGFETLAKGAAESATQMERGFSLMTRLDLVQITLQQSTERVSNAQDKYNAALAEFGAGSEEATRAARDLENAQTNLEKANLRAELSYGLVGAQALAMATTAIPALRTALVSLTTASTAAAGASALLNITLTAGTAAIGIVAGIMAVSAAMDSLGGSARNARNDVAGLAAELEAQTQAQINGAQERIRAKDAEAVHDAEVRRLIATGNAEAIQADIAARQERMNVIRGLLEQENTEFLMAEQRRLQMHKEAAESAKRALDGVITGGADAETVAKFQAVFDMFTANVAESEGILANAVLSPEDASRLEAEFNTLQDDVDSLGDGLVDFAARAAAANQQAAQATRSTWKEALGGVGIDLDSFSNKALAAMSQVAGTAGQMAGELLGARMRDAELGQAALATTPALLDQVSATRLKNESNHELAERLGLSAEQEAELERQGRFTTDGIINQTEATSRLSGQLMTLQDIMARTTTNVKGPSGLPDVQRETPVWVGTTGGAWMQAFPSQVRGLNPDAHGAASVTIGAAPSGRTDQEMTTRAGATYNLNVHLAPGEGTSEGVQLALVRAADNIDDRQKAVRVNF